MERRSFVRHGTVGLLSLAVSPQLFSNSLFAKSTKKIVCVFQRGGVDGLSMVVPYGDRDYYARRRSIALPADSLIDLDGFFGLHPALKPLHDLFVRKQLSIVHAVGTRARIDSHLTAQKFVEDAMTCAAEVEWIDVCGFDTHAAQGGVEGELANRLSEVARTLRTLTDEYAGRDDVVIMTMSEFGRSVAENEVGGTDHGHGTCMLVCGAAVNGGKVVGDWPGLRGRDLRVTTDIRDALALFM